VREDEEEGEDRSRGGGEVRPGLGLRWLRNQSRKKRASDVKEG